MSFWTRLIVVLQSNCKVLQTCANSCKGVQTFASVCKLFAKLCNSLHNFATVYKLWNFCKGLHNFAKLLRKIAQNLCKTFARLSQKLCKTFVKLSQKLLQSLTNFWNFWKVLQSWISCSADRLENWKQLCMNFQKF